MKWFFFNYSAMNSFTRSFTHSLNSIFLKFNDEKSLRKLSRGRYILIYFSLFSILI